MTDITNGATPSASPSGSIAEAAEAFESILSGNDQENEEPDEGAPQPDEPSDQPEEQSDEQEEGEEGQESEGEESEGESEGEEEPEDEPEADPVYAVTVDGQEIEVPLTELVKGYSRTADYTRKTQALAEERKTFQAVATETSAMRDQYAQGLQQLSQLLQQQQPAEPNWDELAERDPIDYARQWADHQRRQQLRMQVEHERRAVMERQQQEAEAQRLERVQQARQWLSEQIPEWKNPETAKAERAAIKAFGLKHGFSPDEMANIDDPRAILLLRLAMQADRAREKAKAVIKQPVKKVVQAPVLKPGPATTPRKTGDLKDAKQRLAKSGTVKDAANYFRTLL